MPSKYELFWTEKVVFVTCPSLSLLSSFLTLRRMLVAMMIMGTGLVVGTGHITVLQTVHSCTFITDHPVHMGDGHAAFKLPR